MADQSHGQSLVATLAAGGEKISEIMGNSTILVKTKVLRQELGVGETYMGALLAACNLKGRRLILRETVLKFLKENPSWTMPKQLPKAGPPQRR